ncbi:tumor necrosis factor receptor superfamily member 14 isoform X1 [Macaca fascicularis]|uniref:TNFR-Cys domain-containing protein n=1 Tax=Macaca fascicularis TaxID=9541 RepID=A0A7N9CGR4_MACFA|nr:tumor necrosis factor receptor superfamily member 14 isoform X1 [Macaca fascicularis]
MPLSWPLLGPASSLSLAARRSRANPDPQHWAYHSEVLYLTFLGSPCYAPALPSCKEDEYPVGSECCPKCGPGFHVRQACGEQTGTVCEPCSPGTYIAHFNGLSKCLQCQMCDPAMGLRTSRNCSTTANALCGCSPGHFCIIQDGDHCAACRAYATSSPGQRVQKGGTESQDTLCQNCPPGTFSSNGTLEECQHGTKCSKWLVTEAGPGTSSFRWVWWLLSGTLIVIIVGLILGLIYVKRRKSRGDVVKVIVSVQRKRQEAEGEAIVTEALQAPPDITTVAVEETEPAFTGRS